MMLSSTEPLTVPGRALCVTIMSTQQAWHGGEAQALLLAAGLRKRGHRVCILARRGTPFPERMAGEGYETETFSGRGRSLVALWQIRRQLQRWRPDVLFYNDPHSLTAGTLAAAWLPVPVRLAARRVDFALRSTWKYLHGADRVVCVSQAVAAACRAGGLPESILRVVHDGVDPVRIQEGNRERGRESLQLADDQQLLLTVAKLTDHKGHCYLLRALPEILAAQPKAVLAFAGDGELRESLQAEAVQLGVEQQVRFLGYRQDVPDLIHAADVVIAPSHLEGLNTSLIDAMLAARPIVTTTAGGIPDLTGAKEPATGPAAWVVAPRNPAALASAVIAALQQPEQGRAFGLFAQQRANRFFTAEQMVTGTLQVIDEVLIAKLQQAA